MVAVPTAPLPSARSARSGGDNAVFTITNAGLDSPTEQIRRLEALISSESVTLRTPAEQKSTVIPSLIELIDSSALDNDSLESILKAFIRNRDLLPRLAEVHSMGLLTHAVQQLHRYQGLTDLKVAIADPDVTTAAVCQLLRRESWVFGGSVVPVFERDELPDLGDDLIAMLRYDSAIHVVIVGPPHVPDLVTPTADGFALTPLVAAAHDRARGLVRTLEGEREAVNERLKIECGRAAVTVLIGHPLYATLVEPSLARDEVRVFNTFSAGITVLTYEELVSVAEQSLSMARADDDR